MDKIIQAYINQVGLEDFLTEVGNGVVLVDKQHNASDLMKECCNDVAIAIFDCRNKLRVKLSKL